MSGELRLAWQDVGVSAHGIFQTLLGHGSASFEPMVCTSWLPSANLPMPEGSWGFAVATRCAGGFSSFGRGTAGAERELPAPPSP